MNSRILAAVLAAGCVTAAGGGAYVALRQSDDRIQPAETHAVVPAVTEGTAPSPAPVTETEAIVDTPEAQRESPAAPAEDPAPARARVNPNTREAARTATPPVPPASNSGAAKAPLREVGTTPAAAARRPSPTRAVPATEAPAVPSPSAVTQTAERSPAEDSVVATPEEVSGEPARAVDAREPARERQFDEIVLPASSVLGLQVETPLSSERTHPEDRVEARVTRDVSAEGRVAVPAGSRVVGSVTTVERGGKMKERARLGVRFHTLVLADGREVPLRTETIIREGDSPSNESARKIGGAAIGGAILGAIMGGGKGAVLGGAAGAAGGSAAVMAGDRNAATLPAGTILSVRLAGPAVVEVERAPR